MYKTMTAIALSAALISSNALAGTVKAPTISSQSVEQDTVDPSGSPLGVMALLVVIIAIAIATTGSKKVPY